MSTKAGPAVVNRHREVPKPEVGHGDLYRFLRYGHVLSALLREILEEGYLENGCRYPLNRVQFCCLKLIAVAVSLKVGEVGRAIGFSAAATSKNIDKLERLGLVERRRSELDRRTTLVVATPEGREVVREYERVKAERLAPVVAGLGPAKLAELCRLLEDVCVRLVEGQGLDDQACVRCTGYFSPDCAISKLRGECVLRRHRRGSARRGGIDEVLA